MKFKLCSLMMVLIFSTLVSLSQQSKSQTVDKTWKVVGVSTKDDHVYGVLKIHTGKIIRIGDLVEFWIKEVPLDGKNYQTEKIYGLTQFKGDCKNNQLGILYIADYKPGGGGFNDSVSLKMDPVIPDTNGESILNAACRLSAKPSEAK